MRLPATAIAVAITLRAMTPASGAQCQIFSGEVTVDDVTNTTPQECSLIEVGTGGMATLHLLDGRLIRGTSTAHIGVTANGLGPGNGTVNVLGNHSRLLVGSTLWVGYNAGSGPGTLGSLNIGGGGHVRAASVEVPTAFGPAEGTVTISGPGSILEVVGALSLRQTGTVAASMTIETGGTLSVGTTVAVTGSPRIFLEGGTLSLTGPSAMPPAGVVQFGSGAFRFRSGQTLDGSPGFYSSFYGSPPVLGAASPGLIVDGTTTLTTALTLEGGSLRTDRIAVDPITGSVSLAGGTLRLIGDGAVLDDGSDFGPDPVTVGDGAGDPAQLVLRSGGTVLLGDVTVMADGALSFSGEALVLDALDNSGRVTLVGATLHAEGGLLNNGSLRLVDAIIEADVESGAGTSIEVSGTVVFNGLFTGAATFYGSGTVIFNGGTGAAPSFYDTGLAVVHGAERAD